MVEQWVWSREERKIDSPHNAIATEERHLFLSESTLIKRHMNTLTCRPDGQNQHK